MGTTDMLSQERAWKSRDEKHMCLVSPALSTATGLNLSRERTNTLNYTKLSQQVYTKGLNTYTNKSNAKKFLVILST